MSGASEHEGAPPVGDEGLTWPQYLWAHAGMISGWILGTLAFCFLAFLSIIGYRPAIAMLVCFVAFFGMIALGARFRRNGR